MLEQSGALVPALPFPLLGKGVTSSTFAVSYMHYSLTWSGTCQLPLRVTFSGLQPAGRRGVWFSVPFSRRVQQSGVPALAQQFLHGTSSVVLLLWRCSNYSGTGATCLELTPESESGQDDGLRAEATSLVFPSRVTPGATQPPHLLTA